MAIAPGIYHDLPIEEYHADEAVSASGISAFIECPAIYKYKVIDRNWTPTRATLFGNIGHDYILEHDKCDEKYVVGPEEAYNKTLKAWNEFKNEHKEGNKTPITFKENQMALSMRNMVFLHPLAGKYLSNGKAEVSFFAKDKDTGLMLRARPDYINEIPGIGLVIIDYKTTGICLGIHKQSNHAMSLDRHIQAAFHADVFEATTNSIITDVIYVTQSVSPPYLVRMFRITPDQIEQGRSEYKQYLLWIAECKAKDIWPGYEETIEDYITPRWFDNRLNETNLT